MKRKMIMFFAGTLLVLSGLFLFSDQIGNYFIKNTSKQYQVTNFTPEKLQKNNKTENSFNFADVRPISSEAILKAKLSNKPLPVIGGIAVPSLEINLPIFKGLSNEALMWGAGTTSEFQEMGTGNYGLASHHAYQEDLLFSPLTRAQKGEKIYLTNLEQIYQYRIVSVEKVSPTDTHWLDVSNDEKLVTLVTCGDTSGVDRIIVQGILETTTPIKEADPTVIGYFDLEQKTY